MFPVHWLILFTDRDDAWFGLVTPATMEYVLCAYTCPFAMCLTAAYIAPLAKYEIGIIAAGIWIALFVVGGVWVLLSFDISGWAWVRLVAIVVATGLSVSHIFPELTKIRDTA
jgi:hypothetical protein